MPCADSTMLPLEAELPEAERDRLLERAAREVVRRRLQVPTVLALELHRPLTFLGSQALIVFTPMLAPAFGLGNLQQLTRLLEDGANLDRLVNRIEELSADQEEDNQEARKPGKEAA